MEGRTLVDSIHSPSSPVDCPIGPIGKASNDIRAWLRQGKDRPYEGPFNLRWMLPAPSHPALGHGNAWNPRP